MKKKLLIVFSILSLVLIITSCNSETKPTNTEQKNKETISKAEFDEIKNGMTHKEVTEIIGGPGEMLSESGSAGDALHTVIYMYKGEGDIGANANMMFQGDKLMNKAQMGLK